MKLYVQINNNDVDSLSYKLITSDLRLYFITYNFKTKKLSTTYLGRLDTANIGFNNFKLVHKSIPNYLKRLVFHLQKQQPKT